MRNLSPLLLKSLALTEKQAGVYLAALELGEANLQALARTSHVKRTSIYNFIDELRERGLITETTKKGRKLYSATDPAQLIEIEKTRVKELERTMPELLAIQNKSKHKPHIRFYEGIENVLTVYNDQLKEQKPIIAYEDPEYMKHAMPKDFYDNWPKERARLGIPLKSICRDSTATRESMLKNPELLRETRLMKADPWKTEISIYGNKVAMMRFGEHDALCVLIEDHDIAETLRSTWQQLWNKLTYSD
jgi:HTH-type transcriptional regulator, sugar sensing transcriptional regulator